MTLLKLLKNKQCEFYLLTRNQFTVLLFLSQFLAFIAAQAQTQDYNHWITDGVVHDFVEDANFIYAAGQFDFVGPPTGNGAAITETNTNPDLSQCRPNGNVLVSIPDGTGGWFIGGSFTHIVTSSTSIVPRNRIAHILNTGQLDLTWNPNASGEVYALALSGSDLFVSGFFSAIGGQVRTYLAKISATGTGNADPTWDQPPNGFITSMVVSGSNLFVGGNFTGIGSVSRNYIAKLSTAGTGTVDPIWNPNASNIVNAIAVSGSDVFVGGIFTVINSTPRSKIAKLNANGTGTVDATWNPFTNVAGSVLSLLVSGTDLYAAGTFTSIGGENRNRVAKFSTTGTGTANPTWNPNVLGTEVISMALSGNVLYLGGNFTSVGGQARRHIAKVSALGTGTLDASWNPNPKQAVKTLAVNGSTLYVGGLFNSIGTLTRSKLVRFDKSTGVVDPTWNPNPNISSNGIRDLIISGTSLFAAGEFTSIGGQTRYGLAKLSTIGTGTADASWNPAPDNHCHSILLSGNDLYVSGEFTNIGGYNINKLAKVSAIGNGTVNSTWTPNPNLPNNYGNLAMALSGNNLFIGGVFTNVGGQNLNRLAKISAIGTGTSDPTWNPNPSNPITRLTISGSDLIAAGNFTTIGGVSRNRLAKVSMLGTGSVDVSWNPNVDNEIHDMELVGSQLYICGNFSNVGGQIKNKVAKVSLNGFGTLDAAWTFNSNTTNYVSTINYLSGNIAVGGYSISPQNSYAVTGLALIRGCMPAPTPINTTPTLNLSICSGNSASLIVASTVNVNWYATESGTNALATGNSFITNTLSAGAYSFYAEASNTCGVSLARTEIVVSVNPSPTININSGTICSGNSFTLTPSGAFTYTYSSGSFVVNPSLTSTYSVVGTSSLGCLSTNTAISTITVNISPTISVNSGSICEGNSFTIIPSGASTYTSSSISNIVSPLSSTLYLVTGTSSLGCVGVNTAVCSVTVNATPSITVNSGTICNGQSFTLQPNGAFMYNYSSGTNIVTPSSNTAYSITGTSAQGCLSSNTAISSVIVNPTPTITVNSGTICSGNTFTFIPNGGVNYTYSSLQSTVSPISSSVYTIIGFNTQLCSSSALSTVIVNPSPTINVNSGAICEGQSFTINPSGASIYVISGGTTIVTPTIGVFSYSVTGTSSLGCVGTNTAVSSLTVNAKPTLSVNSGSICSGKSFTIIPTGASSYSYSSGSAIVSPLTNTFYTVTGTSSAGCASSNTVTSTVTVFISPTITVNSGSICSGKSFTIIPNNANTYTIQGGNVVVNPLISSTYTVVGTSTNGCVSQVAASNISVSVSPTITVNSGSICSGNSFTIIPSGANTYTFSSGSNIVSPLTNTSYSVTGTSSAGCISTNIAISTVTVNSSPSISVNSGSICSGNSFVIIPTGANTYTFSGGTSTVNPNTTTTYSITGSSSLGCVSSNTAISNVSVSVSPTISVNTGSICSGNSFVINPSGANTYTFSSGSSTVNPGTTTSYSVTGTSSVGCAASNTVVSTVTVIGLPTLSVQSTNSLICEGETATLSVSGAISYSWNNGSTLNLITVSPTLSTSYTVTGVNLNGCAKTEVFTQNVNPCASINQLNSFNNQLLIYPNPNNGEFTIDTPSERDITIINALGQVIKQQHLSEGKNTIDLNEQANGIYFLKLEGQVKLVIKE